MSTFLEYTSPYCWQVGLETDIGGGRENQDDCFVWIKKDDNLIVLCVLDGHGREVGKIASESAKACLFKHLDENYRSLLETPGEFLVAAHGIAHDHIRNSFRTELKRQGFDVLTTEDGFLMKRKHSGDCWSCVHGGTSCSIVALVRNELYIANVGDSTGILCSSYGVLAQTDLLKYVQDAAVAPELSRGSTHTNDVPSSSSAKAPPASPRSPSTTNANATSPASAAASPAAGGSNGANTSSNSTLVITAEHSPECPYEYGRLLRYRAREGSPLVPALVVVYDSSTNDKSRCAPVFERDAGGKPCVTNKGSYYKNVRKEWASLVSTPPYAQFQDALAFTRSLGDLHLHTYGVTHLPEVQKIDLDAAFRLLDTTCKPCNSAATVQPESNGATSSTSSGGTGAADNNNGSAAASADNTDKNNGTSGSNSSGADGRAAGGPMSAEDVAGSTLCLVLATDGVWDNWLYEDVNKFVMDPSCLGAVGAGADGAKRVTISFMQRNALYAKRNFGGNADNATGIVMYISRARNFPSL